MVRYLIRVRTSERGKNETNEAKAARKWGETRKERGERTNSTTFDRPINEKTLPMAVHVRTRAWERRFESPGPLQNCAGLPRTRDGRVFTTGSALLPFQALRWNEPDIWLRQRKQVNQDANVRFWRSAYWESDVITGGKVRTNKDYK